MTREAPVPATVNESLHRNGGKRWRFSLGAALVCAVILTLALAYSSWPMLPRAVTVNITFPDVSPGQPEPLLTTGAFEAGDFLVVKYPGANQVIFAYDAWGIGGPSSTPITVAPGSTHTLTLEMPALYEANGVSTRSTGQVRVTFDGQEVLRDEVRFHRRQPREVYFATNPVGGSNAARFRGALTTADHRKLAGGPETYFTPIARLTGWLASPAHIVGVILASVLIGLAVPLAARGVAATATAGGGTALVWFALTALVALAAFTYLITDESFRLIYPEVFGNFYDFQAASLIHGRLDVPEEALSGEAFVYAGKYYGYFGPTPALMRLPFALLGVGFGKLSRLLMLVDFALSLVAIYLLLSHVARIAKGPTARLSPWAVVTFTAVAGVGSTLFYLSSRAYIYHEAILCGAALALWATYCALRYVAAPDSRWWIAGLVCGTLSVHARPPVGLFALMTVGVAALLNIFRAVAAHRGGSAGVTRLARRHFAVGVLAGVGVLSFNGLSYLKFHTIEGCPLRYNVQYTAARLARIDSKQFHWQNLRFGVDAYLLKPTVKIAPQFPFFGAAGLNKIDYPEAKLDMTEHMAGLPYAMPALCFLALAGIAAWRSHPPVTRTQLLTVWLAMLLPGVAMFAAIAVAHRYTTDFVPFLIAAAAFGIVAIDGARSRLGVAGRTIATGLAILSVAITVALTLSFQGSGVWGVPPATQQQYQHWQEQVDRALKLAP